MNPMHLEPVGSGLVIEPAPNPEEITDGGIVVPESARGSYHLGTVLAVGPGERGNDGLRCAMQVRKGDQVLYSNYNDPINFGGRQIVLCDEGNVMAILREPGPIPALGKVPDLGPAPEIGVPLNKPTKPSSPDLA